MLGQTERSSKELDARSRLWPEQKHLGLKMKRTYVFLVVHVPCWVMRLQSDKFSRHESLKADNCFLWLEFYFLLDTSGFSWLPLELSLQGTDVLVLPMEPSVSALNPCLIRSPYADQITFLSLWRTSIWVVMSLLEYAPFFFFFRHVGS